MKAEIRKEVGQLVRSLREFGASDRAICDFLTYPNAGGLQPAARPAPVPKAPSKRVAPARPAKPAPGTGPSAIRASGAVRTVTRLAR